MTPPPFLTVYTPTYRRPLALEQCIASVAAQTVPVEHVIVVDDVGVGIDGMYAEIPRHAGRVTGRYVMVLSDDNVLEYPEFAADLEAEAAREDHPDVVLFKGTITGTVQPVSWGGEPVCGQIDLSCFAVRREVWQERAGTWGRRYEGDFDFIHGVWEAGHRMHWWPQMGFRALRISGGAPE